MSNDRPLSVLDAWDALTRDVRPPARAPIRTRRTTSMVVPLVVGLIVLSVVAVVPNLPEGPGATAGTSPSGSAADSGPVPTDDQSGIVRRLRRIEAVSISDDRRVVRIDFTGASPRGTFDPTHFCSEGYEATARVLGDTLEIGLYALRGTGPFPTPNEPSRPTSSGGPRVLMACTQVGYARSLEIPLDEPFTGNTVLDLAGQTLYLGPPDWLADFGALPDGWKLPEEGNSLGNEGVPRWQRLWSPVRDPDPLRDPMLELFHSHGGPALVDGGSDRSTVEVNGQRAKLHLDPNFGNTGFGEMVLLWWIGEDGFALVGFTRDFTRGELIALAESITLP